MGKKVKDLFDMLVKNRMQRPIALTLAIIVTFTTTYTLILPEITLEKDTAEMMPGITMGENGQKSDVSTSLSEESGNKTELNTGNVDTVSFDAEAKNEDGETETLVHVEADANAFPEGTTMEASVVTDQEVIDTITEATEGEVVAVRAVDLIFTNTNGETVQPAQDSQVSVTLSGGEGDSSDTENEETAASDGQTLEESASETTKQTEESKGEKASSDDQTTETSVVQYTEDNGAEAVELKDNVSFQVEPENDLDQDNAVSFDISEQAGDEDTQTYAIVETVAEDDGAEEKMTEEATVGGGGGEGPEAEEVAPEEQKLPPEALMEEPEESILTAQDEAYLVTVTYGPEAQIPQEASLKVEEILNEDRAYDEHLEETQNALNEAAQTEATETEGVYAGPEAEEPQFFGTHSLMEDPDAYDRQQVETASSTEPEIVYARFFDITILDDDGNEVTPAAPVKVSIELLDTKQDEEIIQNADTAQVVHFGEETEVMEAEVMEDAVAGVSFDAAAFSVYGVVYTVDFYFAEYQSSITGGSAVTLSDLFKTLGILVNVSDVESAKFSNPEYVWVGKVDETVTIGELKEANGLECEYSAELTEDQIAEINAQTVEAGDWALISLHPFTTEETLTVTMKNGDSFKIKVTDGQLHTYAISDSGDTYEVIVTYDDTAEIPENAELRVREIHNNEAGYRDNNKETPHNDAPPDRGYHQLDNR